MFFILEKKIITGEYYPYALITEGSLEEAIKRTGLEVMTNVPKAMFGNFEFLILIKKNDNLRLEKYFRVREVKELERPV
ncbi:MAG: hypothetical protein WC238_00730 [Parcubacteria group bacterium]|jgi:hypothetical protein